MSMTGTKLRTALQLGPRNIARALSYRAGVRTRLHSAVRLPGTSMPGRFFREPTLHEPASDRAEWRGEGLAFGRWPFAIDDAPPDWFRNPVDGTYFPTPGRPWWEIDDFADDIDVKTIWDLSRFEWVIAFAQHARIGDERAMTRLERWLSDWTQRNPAYRGPNWKCGQEASIRVLHLAATALILDQIELPEPGLAHLVAVHLRRIAPTIAYALSQDNNHGTSEAAALFVGGSWLARAGWHGGARWAATGRRWLEERVGCLVGADGSFSQYSLNYHRLLLDTLSFAEAWRQRLDLPPFTARFAGRSRSAAAWLHAMLDPATGDGPNTGANDGTRILSLVDGPYRDYRTSVQLATALFAGASPYPSDLPGNAALTWLRIAVPEGQSLPPTTRIADDGGFAVLRNARAMAMLRYPRFGFRPSQADALHLDLWVDSINILRDAGSFSYNSGHGWHEYFTGTGAHNTVQFDGRDQMPRLGRFLFGDWLRTTRVDPLDESGEAVSFGAEYRDRQGCTHHRRIELAERHLAVTDSLSCFREKAVLRWRLAPGEARVDGNRVLCNGHSLEVSSSAPIARFEIIEGWESRHYLECTPLPVVEIELHESGEVLTEYRWS